MSNIGRHDFDSIKTVHSNNAEATAAFNIIAPFFPMYEDTKGIINLNTRWDQGGTFLSNWNLSIREANCAARILKELQTQGGHDCYFIVPIPSSDGFPDHMTEKMGTTMKMCLRLMIEYQSIPELRNRVSDIPLPLYFSVHTFSRSLHCATSYRDIAMSCVLEDIPDIAIDPQLSTTAKEYTTDYLQAFTLKPNSNNS